MISSTLLYRFRRALLPVGSIILLLAMLAGPAGIARAAGTVTVDRTDDAGAASACTAAANDCSLRGAFAFANTHPGTTISIPSGTYVLTMGELQIGSLANPNTIINGAGSVSTVIQQITIASRVINVNPSLAPNVNVTISNLTLSGGKNPADGFGGGAVIAGGPNNVLTLTNCTISGNSDAGGASNPSPLAKGGGVAFAGGGNLVIDHCLFDGNFASNLTTHSGVGGAVDYQLLNTGVPGSLSISNSIFNNNSASGTGNGAGGAIRVVDTTNTTPRSVVINRNQFTGNQASDPLNSGSGGAIVSTGKNPITVQFNRFSGNTATGSGSAIYQATGTLGSIDARENWWNCNTGPGTPGCDGIGGLTSSIMTSPRLVLAHAASPAAIQVGQSTTFTASFLKDSAGIAVTAANLSGLVGMPVAFTSPQLGVLTSQQASLQASGTASATYLATSVETGSLTAVVGNASVIAQVTINNALVYLPLIDNSAAVGLTSMQPSSKGAR